jgi:cyanobactin maturation PatA/PatG family protease
MSGGLIAPQGIAPLAPAVLSGVTPSQRGSCGSKGGASYAYVLGELGYDFGCEARLDYFVQQLGNMAHAFDPTKMAEHLDENKGGHPEDANALIWTLNIDATPVYAIEPADQFAVISYVMLTRFLVEQEHEGVERISVAGHLTGTQRLYNGTVVPVIAPVTRGMFNWSADKLVESVLGADFKDEAKKEQAEGIRQFLHRIYYDLRNLGTSPQERAMNFAATNAFQLKEVYEDAYREGLQLDSIDVERSPICRPDSDCWDVKLKFFDPAKRLERARKLYRYTVDVSDIVPVTVGTLRTWFIY